MRNLLLTGLLLLAVNGCVSRSQARRQAEQAAWHARAQAIAEEAQRQPAVWVHGDVRQLRVPWAEGLTLSEAILAAQYTATSDPRTIIVTRQGQSYPVKPRHLFNGTNNPLLEAGDVIEIRR